MNRRDLFRAGLGLMAAPAIVRAESLMKLWVPPREIIVPVQELHVCAGDTITVISDCARTVWVRFNDGPRRPVNWPVAVDGTAIAQLGLEYLA